MNLPDERRENSQPAQVSRTAVVLMALIVICLGTLAVFSNVQRSRRDAIEVVAVKSTISPAPQRR